MPPLTQAERDALIDAAFNRTKAEFAQEVSARTALTVAEVQKLAKTEAETQALALVLAEVKNATTSNLKKADAIRKITGGVEALVKIAGLVL